MKTKILIVVLIISLGINVGVIFTAGYRWQQEKGRQKCSGLTTGQEYCWNRSALCKNLNLSSEQVPILEKYREELQSQTLPLREELRLKRLELFNLAKGENNQDEKIDSLVNDIARLQSEIEKKVIQHSIKVKEVLDPEQQKKFNNLFQQALCPGGESLMPCGKSKMNGMR